MPDRTRLSVVILTLPLAFGAVLPVAAEDRVVFMEPDSSGSSETLPTFKQVTDESRLKTYRSWIENEHARRALELYMRAWHALRAQRRIDGKIPPFHIALVPDGNHADRGFRLRSDGGVSDFPKVPYIKLDPSAKSFGMTMLHESGHVVLSVLNDGNGIPAEHLVSIPHTTAALTNRGTAFDEGFAIHLETLAAHLSTAPDVRNRYRHERMVFGSQRLKESEYSRHAVDLATFSQDLARYQDVRDNNFAFAAAYRGPDYLRVQLEKSRDFATLRSANQLLQSEGFYASFFFAYLMRGDAIPSPEVLSDRQDKMLRTLAENFNRTPLTPDTPHLLAFVEGHMHLFPDEARDIVNLLLDLSHGVFVDADAARLWREHYLAALRLDLKVVRGNRVGAARDRWREAVLADPKLLYSRLGPQVQCVVSTVSVSLVAFGASSPLSFDINTAQEGIIRLIPHIRDADVAKWIDEREQAPFTSEEDFKQRVALTADCLADMRF